MSLLSLLVIYIAVVLLYMLGCFPVYLKIVFLALLLGLGIKNHLSNKDQKEKSLLWARFAMGTMTLIAAFSWQYWHESHSLNSFLLFSGVKLLLLFGLLFLLDTEFSKMKKLSAVGKGVAVSLFLFACTLSALALFMSNNATTKELTGMFQIDTVAGNFALPSIFTGSNNFQLWVSFAGAAWILFFGGLIFLRGESSIVIKIISGNITKRGKDLPVKIWLLLVAAIAISQLINPLLPVAGLDASDKNSSCCLSHDLQSHDLENQDLKKTHIKKAIKEIIEKSYSAKLQLFDFAEKSILQSYFSYVSCKGYHAEALYMASRLAVLTADDKQNLLKFASELAVNGAMSEALNLFTPQALSTAELSKLKAANMMEAYFLSEVWRSRNYIDEVVQTLKPFVDDYNCGLANGQIKEQPKLWWQLIMRYADYSMYVKDLKTASTVALTMLAINPKHNGALNLLGEVYYEEDMMVKAFKSSFKAYKMSPFNVRYVGNLIAIYVYNGDEKFAMPLMERMILSFPGKAWKGTQGGELHQNGVAYLQGDFTPGRMRLEIVCKGSMAKGQWPIMEVWVNDNKVGMAIVDKDQPLRYAFEFETRRGPNRIEVRYNNNYEDDKEDRNLYLGSGFFKPIYYKGKKR